MLVLVGAAVVGTTIGWIQAVGVLLVGGGIVLVRGLLGRRRRGRTPARARDRCLDRRLHARRQGGCRARGESSRTSSSSSCPSPSPLSPGTPHAADSPRSGRDRMGDLRRVDLRVRGVRVRSRRADARLGACGRGGARDERPLRGRARSGRARRAGRPVARVGAVLSSRVAWWRSASRATAAQIGRALGSSATGICARRSRSCGRRVLSSATTFHRLHEMGASRPFLLRGQCTDDAETVEHHVRQRTHAAGRDRTGGRVARARASRSSQSSCRRRAGFCVYIDHADGVDHALCERVTLCARRLPVGVRDRRLLAGAGASAPQARALRRRCRRARVGSGRRRSKRAAAAGFSPRPATTPSHSRPAMPARSTSRTTRSCGQI